MFGAQHQEYLSVDPTVLDTELIRLRDSINQLGGHDISLCFVLRETSLKRGDMVYGTTLPACHTDLYWPSGGANSDPILMNALRSSEPIFTDLREICFDSKTKYFKNKFLVSLINSGRYYLAGFPFFDPYGPGYGVLTVFDSREPSNVKYNAKQLTSLCQDLHLKMKINGHYNSYFDINAKERVTLNYMASGLTADDIAAKEDVSRRSIELRLANARKKLKARTTTEAVFKGTCYGVLNQTAN